MLKTLQSMLFEISFLLKWKLNEGGRGWCPGLLLSTSFSFYLQAAVWFLTRFTWLGVFALSEQRRWVNLWVPSVHLADNQSWPFLSWSWFYKPQNRSVLLLLPEMPLSRVDLSLQHVASCDSALVPEHPEHNSSPHCFLLRSLMDKPPHAPKIFKAHPRLVHQEQLHLFFLDRIWEGGSTPVQPPKQQLLVRTSLFLWVSWAGKTSEFILLYLALFWSGTNKVSWLFQKSPIVSLGAHPLKAWGWKVTPLLMPLPQKRMEQPSRATAPKKHLY